MMDYIIKDLTFKKTATDCMKATVKIHDVLHIDVHILKHFKDNTYHIQFYSHNGYKCFETSDEPCSRYFKYGFKTYEDAYEYANNEVKKILTTFIACVLVDIDDYIKEIENI